MTACMSIRLIFAVFLGCACFAKQIRAKNEGSYRIRVTSRAGNIQTLYSFKSVNYVTFAMSGCQRHTIRLGKVWKGERIGKLYPGLMLPKLVIELSFGDNADINRITTRVGSPNTKVHTFKKTFFDKNDCPSSKLLRFYVKWAGPNGRIEFGTTDSVLAVVYDQFLEVDQMDMDSRTVADFKIFNPNFRPAGECCQQHNNRYCVVPGMGCRFFTQDALGRGYLHSCGKNLQYNPKVCVCDHATTTACNV